MRLGPGRLVILCGLVPTIVAALLSLFRPSFLSNWEYGTYDAILRATPTRPPGGRIIIVDIDDRSLTTVGQWPWRRDVIGQLISRLRDLGASIVALDIMFAEPDRFEGFGTTPDEKLAETLAGGRVVLGYAMTFDGASDTSRRCLLHPLGLAVMSVTFRFSPKPSTRRDS
jgi:adenylate cyclase